MNRQLAIFFAWAIEWVAAAIIMACAAGAYIYSKQHFPQSNPWGGAAVGAGVGFCIAVLVCGPLAVIAQIENHLREMRPDADKTELHLAEIKSELTRAIADAKSARSEGV